MRGLITKGCAALLFALGWVAAAQAVVPRFDRVAVDMIPREAVAALAQDRDGFLWVATGDGVARFDGLRLQPQELTGGRTPVERNLGWVRALLAARDGRVWMGTEDRGLAVYDPRDEKIRLADPEAGQQPVLMALAEDRDGAIWAGGLGGGLVRHDPAGGAARHWHAGSAPGSLPDERIQALLVDRDGRLWVGNWAGLVRRVGERFEPVAPELAGRSVQALLQAGDGAIWAGSADGTLLRLDIDGRRLSLPPSPAGAVTALAEPEPGLLWVGREGGIELRDARSGALQQWLRHRPLQPEGLAGDSITALLTDARGVLWVAGLGLGLQRHDPKPRALRVRGPDVDAASPLANPNVQALLARRNGQVWAATDAGGIAVLDAGLEQAQPGPRHVGRVDAMAEGPDGRLWLGLPDAVHELAADGRTLRVHAHGGGRTRRLLVGRDGDVWIAAADGLWRLAPGAAAPTRVACADGGVLGGEVHALAEAEDGALWVAASQGLLRLPRGAGAAEPVRSPPGEGLANPVVIGLLFDRRGRLWLDTAVAGLHRLRGWQNGLARFDRIGERLGAGGRPFGVNLLEDARGRIWSQMQVYDPAADRLDALGAADGVRIGMPWFFSYAQTADGRMLFGGTRGILEVQPEAWQPEQARPTLRIAGHGIDGERLAVQAALAGLVLEPGTQRLLIDVAMLDVAMAERLSYQYRVDGIDAGWLNSAPGQRQLSLLQPAPGDYRLRLRAGPDAPELQLPLRVRPAWWQTRWAWAAAVLGLAGGFALLLRGRTAHLLARQRELEARVHERTQALEEASLTDPLTGLRNRRYLLEHIEADCAAARRRVGSAAADLVFFLVDLDHFKLLNDTYGHAAGDAVLAQIRARLCAVFRAGDAMVRWGGEEFLVAVRDSARGHAPDLAERLRQCVAGQPFDTPAGPLDMSCSVGFAAYPLMPARSEAFGWQEVVGVADAALYAAKSAGRNRWRGVERVDGDDAVAARAALAAGVPPAVWRAGP
ncbi:two-component regulator propeller domain-containing protein [Roseateles saccharophilus]|uniref:diguanylate cyclase n=1 Tax=Roseateles saccharophilus TaxID=304 RepID=A0A4V2VPG3_ROSSA|nr:two-component regulator propeller domain-containing protein [Roseateles saccharophilus]MDG0834200.1 diguanylate cyclase [Roseateles saccharophilus]TCU89938.1 diguanylate cyclase (GGDEF)-like protein [Roseateles saccharophilus]